jgi:hypothetical protein
MADLEQQKELETAEVTSTQLDLIDVNHQEALTKANISFGEVGNQPPEEVPKSRANMVGSKVLGLSKGSLNSTTGLD